MPPMQEGKCYRLHRVICPLCGYIAWLILDARCSPAEVEAARDLQMRRMLTEPCELHEM
jgi:hypothetical protein